MLDGVGGGWFFCCSPYHRSHTALALVAFLAAFLFLCHLISLKIPNPPHLEKEDGQDGLPHCVYMKSTWCPLVLKVAFDHVQCLQVQVAGVTELAVSASHVDFLEMMLCLMTGSL